MLYQPVLSGVAPDAAQRLLQPDAQPGCSVSSLSANGSATMAALALKAAGSTPTVRSVEAMRAVRVGVAPGAAEGVVTLSPTALGFAQQQQQQPRARRNSPLTPCPPGSMPSRSSPSPSRLPAHHHHHHQQQQQQRQSLKPPGQSPHHPTASAGSAPTAGAVAMDGAELLSQLNPSLHFMVQSLRQGRLSDVMCPVMVLGNTKAHAAAAWAALSATWGSSSSSGHLTSSATFPAASATAANAVPVATTVVPPSSTAEAASSPFVSASMSGDAAATTAEAPYALPLITPQTVVGLVGHGNSTNNNNSSATITTTSGSCTLPASMRSDHSGSRHNFSHALLGSIMEYEGVDVDDEQARARGVGAERARAAAAMAHGDFAGTSAFGSQAPPSVAHTMAGQRLSINPFLDSFAPGGSSTAAPSLTHFSESAAQLITPWPFLYANDTAVGLLGYHKLEDVESQDLESVFRCFVYAPEGSEGKGEGDDDVSTPPPPPLHHHQQQQRISLSSAISDGSSTMASVADLAATATPSAARGTRLSNSGATTEPEAVHSTLKRQPPATADAPPLSLDALLRPSRQTSAASPDFASSSPVPPQQQPASAAATAPSRTSFLRELHSPEELFSPGYDGYVFLYSERTASYYAALAVSTDDVDVPSRAASTAPATQLHPYMRLFGSLSKWRDANSITAAAAAAAAGEGGAARTAPRMSLSQPAVKETTSPSLTAPTTTTGATAAAAAVGTRQRLSVVSPAFCSQSKYVVLYILQRIETGKTPLVPPRPPVAKPDEKADAHDNNSSNSSGQRRVTGIYTPTSTAAATVNANAHSPAPAAAVAPLLRPDLTPIGAPLLGSDAQVDVDAPSPLRWHNIQLLQQQQQQQQRPRAFSPTTTHVAADPPNSQVLRNVESGEHHSLMEVPSWTPRSSAEWNASNTNTSNTTQSDGARAALPSAVRDGNNSDANNNNNKRHSLFELSYTPFQAQLAKPGRVSSDYVADGFVAGGDGSTPSCADSTTTTNTRQTGDVGGHGDTAVSGAGNGNDGVVAISSSGDTTSHSGPFSRHQHLSSPTTRDLNAGEGEEHAAGGLRARRGQMSSLLPLAPMTHQLGGVPPTPLSSVGSLPQQAAGGNTHNYNNNSDTPLSGPLPLSPMQPSHVTAATVAPWKAMQEVRSVEAVAQLAQRVREASQASTDASRLGHGVSSAGTPGGSSPLASTSVTRETGSGILMNSQSPSTGGPPPASVWGRRSSRPSVGFPGTQGSGEPRPVSPRSMHSSSTTTVTTHPSSHAHNAANTAAAAGRGLSRVPSRVMGSGDATGGSRSASQVLGNTAAMTWQRSNEVDQIATKKLADRIRSQRNVVTVMTSSRLPDTLIFNSVAFMIFVQQVLRFQQSNGVTQVVCLLNVRSKTQLVVDLIPMDLLDVEEGEGEDSATQGEGHKIRSRRSSPASLTGAFNSAPQAAAATPSPPPISAERLEVLLRRRLARLNAFYSEEESRQTFPSRGESGQSMHNNNSSSHGSTPLIGGHLDNTHHSSNSAAEASLPLQTAKRAGSFVLSRPLDGPLKQDASTLSSSSFDQRGDGEHRATAAATSVTMGRASDTSHTVAPMSEPATDTDGGHHQHLQQQPRSTSPVTSVGHVTVRAADGSHKHSSRHRSSSHREHHHHHHSCHSPNASLSSVQRQLRESRRSHTHDHKTKRESGSAAATAAAAAAAAAAAPIKSMHWAYARRTASEPIARQARSPMVMIAEAAARVTEGSRNVSRSNSFAHSGARTPPSQWASSLTSHYAVQPSSDATSAHTAAAKRESDTNSTAAALATAAAAAVAPQPARSLLQHQRSPFNPSMVRLASDAGDSGSTSCNTTTRNSNSSINNSSSSRQNQSSRAGSSWSAQWAGSATGLQQHQHQRSSLPSSSQQQQQQQQCYPPLQWVPKSDFLSADTQQNLAMCDGDITVTARTLEAQVRIPFITPQRLELLSQLGNVQLSTYRGLSVFGVNLVNLVTEEAAAAAAQPAPPIIALQYDLAARKYKKDARAKSTVLPPFNDEDAAAQGAEKAARRRRTGADAAVQAVDEGNSDVAAKRHTDVRSASAAAANATASATATALSATAGGQAGLRPPALSAPPRPPGSIAAAGLALVPLDVEKDSAADRGGTAAPALTPTAASENATTNSNNNNRSPSQVSLFAPDHSRSPTREVQSESAAFGTPQHNSPSLPRSTVEKGCVVSLLGAAAGSARPQPPSPPPPRRLSMLSMAAAGESEEEGGDDDGAASDDAREAKTKGAGFMKASREREGQAGAQVKLGEGGGSHNNNNINRDTHATDAAGVVGTQKRKSGGLMLPMVLSDPDKAQHAADTAAVLPVATRAAASSADDTHDDSGHPLPHEQHTSHTDSAAVFSRDTQRALFPEGFPEGDNWLVQSNEQSTSLTLIAQTSSPALSVSPGSPTDRVNPSQSSQAQLSVSPPPALPHPVLVCGRATSPSAHHVDPLATPASTASNTQGLVSVRTQKSGGTELLGYTLSNSAAAAFGGFSTALMKEVTLEDVKDGSSATTAAVEGRRTKDADTHSSTTRRKKRESSLRTSPSSEYSHRSSQRDGDGRADQQRASAAAAAGANLSPARRATPLDPEQHPRKDNHSGSDATPTTTATTTTAAAEKEVAAALDLEMDSPMSVRSLSPRSMANTKVAMQSCAAASESMSMSIELMVASGGGDAEEISSGVEKKQTSAAVAAPPPQLLLPTVRVPPESTTTATASAAPRQQEVSTPPRTASAAATGHSDSGSDATANSMISFPVSSGAATVEDARQLSVQRDEANDSFAESFMDIFGLTSHPQRLAELRRQVVERVRDARNRSQSGIDSSINSSGFLNTSASRSGGATAATAATTTAATASAGAAGGGVTASASSFRVGHGGGTSTTFPSQLSYGDTANISAFSGGRGLTTSVPLVLAHSGAADSHGAAGGGRSTTSSANSTTVNARTGGGGGGDSKLNVTKGDEIIKDPQRELRAVAEDAADQVMRHNLHVLVYTPRASPEMDEVLGLYGHCTTFVTTPAKMLLYAQAGLQPFDVLIVDWTECLVNAEIHDMLEKRAVDETVVVFFISTRPGVHTPTMNVENVMTDTTVVIHADDLLTGLLARNVLAEVQQLIRRRRLLMSMVDMRMQQSYQIVSHIGSGAFGDVFEVLMFVSHGKLAMKRIFLKSMKLRQLEVINREVCILRSLEHPNIVSFSHTQLEDNAYSIFMELCDGNLADHLLEPTTAIPGVAQRQHYRYGQAYYSGGMASASDATSGSSSSAGGGGEGGHSGPHSLWGTPLGGGGHAPLSHQHAHHHGGPNMHGNSGNNNNSSSGPALMRPQDAVMIVHDIASALAYLHGRGIIHRDIKPANILFSNGMAKLGDFGSAVKMNESRKLRNMKGTMSYMAPEMVLGEPYTEACDLWSFGCLIASIMGIHLGHLSGLHMPALNELYRSIPMDGSLPLTCSNRFSTKFENHYTDMTTNRVLAALKRALATEMEERAKTPPPPSALRPAHSPYTSPSSSQANVSLGSDTVDEATQERRRVIAELQRADAQSRLRSVTCISTTTIDVLGEFPMQLPASLVELFENLFHRDPARRMTAAELLDHPVSWDVEWMTHMMLEVQKTYAQLSLSTMNARGSPLGAGRGRGTAAAAAAAGGTCGLTGSESEGLNLPGRNAHGSVQPAGYVSYFTESFHGAGEMGGVDLLGGGEAGVNVPCSANDYVLDLSLSGGSGDDSGDD